MEVATTSNHSQQQQQQQRTAMTAVDGGSVRSPFQREVREWQRVDPDTGALLTGRLEADRWSNGPLTTYGKKSTSSISSTNSSNSSSVGTATALNTHKRASKISLHSIVSNKSNNNNNSNDNDRKSSVPATTANVPWQQQQQQQPSPRNSRLYEQQPALYGNGHSNGNSLTKFHVGVSVSNGEGAGADAGDDAASFTDEPRHNHQSNTSTTPTQANRQSRCDLESFRHYNDTQTATATATATSTSTMDAVAAAADDDDDLRLTARHQRRQQNPPSINSHLTRARSISTEDLSTEWSANDGLTDEPGEWQRVSVLRRSFQSALSRDSQTTSNAPKRPIDLPASSVSVSKIRAELENGRRLNTAMRSNHLNLAALDSILNGPAEVKPAPAKRTTFLTAESLKEIRGKLKKLSDESLYKEDFLSQTQQPAAEPEQLEVQQSRPLRQLSSEASTATQRAPAPSSITQRVAQHTTNSLESRQKYRDTTSAEWHLRRKSYGFEKMSPPSDKSMFGMDASTDSGLGRSSELGNWSPTETSSATRVGGTVIQFGEGDGTVAPAFVRRRYRPLKSSSESAEEAPKRHSIAVDESQYVRDNLRKTTQVHLNGFYEKEELEPNASTFLQRSQQKRVEFCKTEVHFAAESGRVNIVETDGKPPPTNNFRRRRRTTSGPLQSIVKTSGVALPITQFGDEHRRKTIATSTVAYKAGLEEPLEESEPTRPYSESARNSYADVGDYESDDFSGIRGILKNKPIKPRPYHLGENFDRPDALWGVQLKPVGGVAAADRRDSMASEPNGDVNSLTNKSVAERIRFVEKRQDYAHSSQTNGFSTKINVSLGDDHPDWAEAEYPKSNVMNIELHSPQATGELAPSLKVVQPTPIAKPRTISAPQRDHSPLRHKTLTTSTIEPTKDHLKIIKEARGARKLRDHELSYFGVQTAKNNANDAKTKLTYTTTTNERNIPKRKESGEIARTTNRISKWQLVNDKPDLLRHSPISVEPKVVTRTAEIKSTVATGPKNTVHSALEILPDSDEEYDEHLYENITNELQPVFRVKSPTEVNCYDRKTDLRRDAMILTEMTKNADQTLKAISKETAHKDQRRRSLPRRHSKPLETISEKGITEKINNKCIAVKVSRSTLACEAKRSNQRNAATATKTRSSSQSSIESGSRPRSRSASSERDAVETKSIGTKQQKHTGSRSSSRESQASSHRLCSSSGDEERGKREERLCVKHKRLNSSTHAQKEEDKRHREHEQRDRSGVISRERRHRTEKKLSSPHRERNDRDHHPLQRASGSRRPREIQDAQKSRPSNEKHEKRERSHGSSSGLVRSSRVHEHDLMQRTVPKSERMVDKEKDKLSRSRELLVLGILIMGATQPQNLHKEFRSFESLHNPQE